MKVVSDYKAGTYTLVPTDYAERTLIIRLLERATPADKFRYRGQAEGSEDGDTKLHFNFGGVQYSPAGEVWGGINFVLQGSDKDSGLVIGGIRNMCYFATGGLLFLGEAYEDGEWSMVCTGTFCVQCDRPIAGLTAGSHICDCCAATCEHDYRPTIGLGFGFDQAVGVDCCTKCQRASPESLERAGKLTRIERFAEAKQRGDIDGYFIEDLNMEVDEALEFQNTGKLPARMQAAVEADPALREVAETVRQELLHTF